MHTGTSFSYRHDPAVPDFPDDRPIIVFDGHCVMCSGWANFVLRQDRKARYRLLPAQTPLGRALYVRSRWRRTCWSNALRRRDQTKLGSAISPTFPLTKDGFTWRASRTFLRAKWWAHGLILHSDRGSRYCADDYRKLVAQFGMKASMSRKGNCISGVNQSLYALGYSIHD
jgi:transposase InsO family protein